MGSDSNYLFISDLQIPFHNSKALSFCKYLQKHYKIPESNILCAGDEIDNYWGSMFKKDPMASHTADEEIKISNEELKHWYAEFPQMRLCESNHGIRWKKKAFEAEIPEILLRQYSDVIEAPAGWRWAKEWLIETKHPFLIEHGDDYGGQMPHVMAAMHAGLSVMIGHWHALFSIDYIKTRRLNLWAAVAGCLIDPESYAFRYTRNHKRKPVLGCAVIVDDGRRPILHPMD